jgi:hypothetical protein
LEDPDVEGKIMLKYSGSGMRGVNWIDVAQNGEEWRPL